MMQNAILRFTLTLYKPIVFKRHVGLTNISFPQSLNLLKKGVSIFLNHLEMVYLENNVFRETLFKNDTEGGSALY